MQQNITQHLINQQLLDINPVLAGWCTNVKAPPIWQKKRYTMLLYYITKGSFTLVTEEGPCLVHEGQAFFLSLTDLTTYAEQTDPNATYDFRWVGFTGVLSHRFSSLPKVIDVPEQHLTHLKELTQFGPNTAYDLAADLLLLRASMFDGNEPKRDYIQTTIDYINSSYMHPITVESLAAQVGLERSYLSRLFKQKTGQTLQKHLQLVRIQEAKYFMIQGCSVKEAAYRCGFADHKNFHKAFLHHEGITPTTWKKCMLENLSTMQNKWPEGIIQNPE